MTRLIRLRESHHMPKDLRMLVGLADILDGLIMVLSFGFFGSKFALLVAMWATGVHTKRHSKKQQKGVQDETGNN